MAQELTTVTQEELEAFLKASGQNADEGGTRIPRVRVNKDGEDDAGNTIPVGTFAVSQNGVVIYGKTATLRVIKNAYQYSVYDETENKYINQTILFPSFNDEAIDELGTIACGKISKKKLDNVSKEVLDAQKKIKCYRYVYGLLTMDGVDAQGNKTNIKDLPVQFRLSGSNFMPIQQEALDLITKRKLMWSQVPLKLGTKRQKQGTNVWYEIVIEPDFDNLVQITPEDISASKLFNEIVGEFNNSVLAKYKKAKSQKSSAMSAREVINELDNDLNDDISDIGVE